MYRYVVLAVVTLFFALSAQGANRNTKKNSLGERQIYVAPKIGISIPTRIGRGSDEVSFADVASTGLSTGIDVMCMQNPFLGVGAEVCYNTHPYKEQYWDNLAMRGAFDAKYKSFSALALGRLFMSEQRLKPFAGIGAGAYLIKNSLDFQSKWQGTSQDESVSYTTNIVTVAIAGELGLIYKAGTGTFVSLCVRMNAVPRLKEEVKTTQDPYTFVERTVVLNPHGNENNFEIKLGVHFGLRARYRK